MNIIISPSGKMGVTDAFKYTRLLKSTLDKVKEKNPESPQMLVSMDDFSCVHVYEFTGNTTPGGVTVPQCAIARCIKCNSQIAVRPRVVNAESIKTPNSA